MIKTTINGKQYDVPSTYSDITLEQFQKIATLLETPTMDVWAEVIAYLCGIEDEDVLNLDMDSFIELADNIFAETEYSTETEWNGLEMKIDLNKINTRTMIAIERAFKRGTDVHLAVMATLYSEPALSVVDNLKPEAIDLKIEKVRSMPAHQAIPSFMRVSELMLKHMKVTI